QNRGGRGVQGMGTHENDFVEHLVSTSTHDTILFFTNKGKVYRLKGYEIPEFGRTAKGLPIINLLQIEKDEWRSEEHTSELQSRFDLVCRLLLEKKNDI